jgi:hypothetical protein
MHDTKRTAETPSKPGDREREPDWRRERDEDEQAPETPPTEPPPVPVKEPPDAPDEGGPFVVRAIQPGDTRD